MQYEHPHITVSSPAPGHYVIAGLRAGSTSTEEGRLVHPMSVHISPEVPNDLLYAIINDRGAVPGPVTVEDVGGVKDSVIETNETGALGLILEALKDKPMRIRDLADKVGVVTVDDIKALAGNGFELGVAGWVKLSVEGGEA
jgi:hypothetical protein